MFQLRVHSVIPLLHSLPEKSLLLTNPTTQDIRLCTAQQWLQVLKDMSFKVGFVSKQTKTKAEKTVSPTQRFVQIYKPFI